MGYCREGHPRRTNVSEPDTRLFLAERPARIRPRATPARFCDLGDGEVFKIVSADLDDDTDSDQADLGILQRRLSGTNAHAGPACGS